MTSTSFSSAIESTAATARRPLTDAEKSSWLLNEVASMQGTHVVHLRGFLDQDLLRAALVRLQQRHFLLRCRIVAGPPAEFVEDQAEIPVTVKPWQDGLWIEEAEREVDDVIPWAAGPLARVVLLQSRERCDLILSMHKAMHDGRSGANALRDVLEFAAAIHDGREPDLPPLTGTHDITDQVRSKSNLWRLVPFFARYLATIVKMRPATLVPDGSAPLAQIRTGLHHRVLSRDETRTLLERCRANQTTVQGALAAAFMQAVAGELSKKNGKGKIAVDNASTYDVRSLLDTPIDDSMGTFVSATISFHYAGPSVPFWNLAREVRDEIARNVNSGLVFTMIRIQTLMSSRAKSPEKLARQVEKFRKPATFVTNFGNFNYPEKVGPWTREYQSCVLSAKHFGGSCLSAVALTVSGRLSLNFFYAVPFFTREHVASLAGDVLGYLQHQ